MSDDPKKRPSDSANQPNPPDDSGLDSEETVRAKPGHGPKDSPPAKGKVPLDDTAFLEMAKTVRSNTPQQPAPGNMPKEDTDFLEYAVTKSSNTPPAGPPTPPKTPAAHTPPGGLEDMDADVTQIVPKQGHAPTPQSHENAPPQSLDASGTMIFTKMHTPGESSGTQDLGDALDAGGTMIFSKQHAPPSAPKESYESLDEGGTMMIPKRQAPATPGKPGAPAPPHPARPPVASSAAEAGLSDLDVAPTRGPVRRPLAPLPGSAVTIKTPPIHPARPPVPPTADLAPLDDLEQDVTRRPGMDMPPPPPVKFPPIHPARPPVPPQPAPPKPVAHTPPPAPPTQAKPPVSATQHSGPADDLDLEITQAPRHAVTPSPLPPVAAKAPAPPAPSKPVTPAPPPTAVPAKPTAPTHGVPADDLDLEVTQAPAHHSHLHSAPPPVIAKTPAPPKPVAPIPPTPAKPPVLSTPQGVPADDLDLEVTQLPHHAAAPHPAPPPVAAKAPTPPAPPKPAAPPVPPAPAKPPVASAPHEVPADDLDLEVTQSPAHHAPLHTAQPPVIAKIPEPPAPPKLPAPVPPAPAKPPVSAIPHGVPSDDLDLEVTQLPHHAAAPHPAPLPVVAKAPAPPAPPAPTAPPATAKPPITSAPHGLPADDLDLEVTQSPAHHTPPPPTQPPAAKPPPPSLSPLQEASEILDPDATREIVRPPARPAAPPPVAPPPPVAAKVPEPPKPIAPIPPPLAPAKPPTPISPLQEATEPLDPDATREIKRPAPPAPATPPKPPISAAPIQSPSDDLDLEATKVSAPAPPKPVAPTPPPPAPAKPPAPPQTLQVSSDDLDQDGTKELTRRPAQPPGKPATPTSDTVTSLGEPPPRAPEPPTSDTVTSLDQPPLKAQPPAPSLPSDTVTSLDDDVTRPSPSDVHTPPSSDTVTAMDEGVTRPAPDSSAKTPSDTKTASPHPSDTKTIGGGAKGGDKPLPRTPPHESDGVDKTSTETVESSSKSDTPGSDFDVLTSDAEDTTVTPRSKRTTPRVRSSFVRSSQSAGTSSTADQLIAFLTERATENQPKINDLHWHAGDKIGDANHTYHLIRPLGKGGFGEVWLALDTKDDMQIALKLVNLDDIGLEATRKEIQNNYKLDEFRSFIRIYSDMEHHGWLAISMEYVDGASFSQIMKTALQLCERKEIPRPYFEPEEIRSHVKQLCTALDYLHNLTNRRGKRSPLIHCDIKPANLMVSKPGYQLKVADLGIARQAVSMSMSRSHADPNQGAMALAYGSPQQYDDLTPEPSDDIYAVGATIYHFLTGAPPPFNAEKLHRDPTLVQPSMTGQREKLWKTWKDKGHEFARPERVPESWERAVAACLAARREDRPESTLKVLDMLGLPPSRSAAPESQPKPEKSDKPLTFEELIAGTAKEKRFASRYILRERLGKGGMGVVWRAEDRRFKNQMAALKFLKPDVAETILKTELMAKNLVHDHIVKTQDYLEDGDLLAIPMEYVKGATLEQGLSERKKDGRNFFEVDEVKDWLMQLCDALNYAHNYTPPQAKKKSAIIHRDIKPSNLMIGEDGSLKILDFGLARKVDQSVALDTNYNEGLTIAYASPQQADKQNPKVTDDIYSVGATLYHMLTGAVPPASCKDLLAKRNNPPKQPSIADRRTELHADEPNQRVGKEVPAIWERTIASCLSFDPDVRPQSAWEILEMLGLKPRDLRSGSLVFNNQFKLDRVLQETPEAEIWLAHDEKLKANIKLVIYSRELSQKPEFAAKLEQAVFAAKVLEGHPHVAQTYGVHYDPKRPLIAIAMEYIQPHPGEDKPREFFDLRPRGMPFCDVANITKYVRQLCETLAFAHGHNITHQDIQSGNLLIDNEGSFVVAGFGIADCVREASGAEVRPPATPDEDIYAMGATIYQCLTDTPPFSAERDRSTTRRRALPRMQERREQKVLSSGRTSHVAPVPKRWETAVARCLDKEPSKRPSPDEIVKLIQPTPKWLYPTAIGAPLLLLLIISFFYLGGIFCTVTPAGSTIQIYTLDNDKSNYVGTASNWRPKFLSRNEYHVAVSAKGYKAATFSKIVPGPFHFNWSRVNATLDRGQGTLRVVLDPPDFDYKLLQTSDGQEMQKGRAADLTQGIPNLTTANQYTLTLTRPFWPTVSTNINFDGGTAPLTVHLPYGKLQIPQLQPSVTLNLDGKQVTDLSGPIPLMPGQHTVSEELEGWKTMTRQFQISNNVTADPLRNFSFDYSTVTIACDPADTMVSIDGAAPVQVSGKEYVDKTVQPLVKRTYIFSKEGFEDQPQPLEAMVDYGRMTNLSVTLRKKPAAAPPKPVAPVEVAVQILTSPENVPATVKLGNQVIGPKLPPFDFTKVKPSEYYTLTVEAPGYDTVTTPIRPGIEGLTNSIALARSLGRMRVTSQPMGVSYSVTGPDGFNRSGITGPGETLSDLPTGSYKVAYLRDGFPTGQTSIEVTRAQTARADYAFPQGELRLVTRDCPPEAQITVGAKSIVKSASGVSLLDFPPGTTVAIHATYRDWDDVATNITIPNGRTIEFPIAFVGGSIEVRTEPPVDARLALNSLEVGPTPYTNRFIKPGDVSIAITPRMPYLPVYLTTNIMLSTRGGRPQIFIIPLTLAQGILKIIPNLPEATELFVNGKTWPLNQGTKINAGNYSIVATNRQLALALTNSVTIRKDDTSTVPINFSYATVNIEGQPNTAKLTLDYDNGATRPLRLGAPNFVVPGRAVIKFASEGWNTMQKSYTIADQRNVGNETWTLTHTFPLNTTQPEAVISEGANRAANNELTLAYGPHKLTVKYGSLTPTNLNFFVDDVSIKDTLHVPRIPNGTVVIKTDPAADGEVLDSGRSIGRTGIPLLLDPGEHRFAVRVPGYEEANKNIVVEDSPAPLSELITLVRAAVPPPIGTTTPPPAPRIVVNIAGAYTNSIGMALVWIPGVPGGGAGSAFGKTGDGAFVSVLKVTQDNFKVIEGNNPSKFNDNGNNPVESMTSDEANEFCDKLTARDTAAHLLPTGWRYKLPTRDQWNYIAQSSGIPTDKTELAKYGWMIKDKLNTTSPVGTKAVSPNLPLYDLVGDVFELTSTPAGDGGYIKAGGAYNENTQVLQDNLKGDVTESLDKDQRSQNTGLRVWILPQ